jgi:hypothetical protein
VSLFRGLPKIAQRNITGKVCCGLPSVSGRQARVSGQFGWGLWSLCCCGTYCGIVVAFVGESVGESSGIASSSAGISSSKVGSSSSCATSTVESSLPSGEDGISLVSACDSWGEPAANDLGYIYWMRRKAG